MSFAATLRALAAPRRAVPLAGVAAALVLAEWSASGAWLPCAIDLGLVVVFCLLAPGAWRAAAAHARRRPPGWIGYALYVALGVLVVLGASSAPPLVGLRGTYVVDPGALGLLLVLFLVGGWGLGRDIDLEQGIESAQRRADRMALDAERARVVAMRAQLDPHFLFNTLNAIAEWCSEDAAKAERATLELAAMLRAILEASSRPSWPLAREVGLIEQLAHLYAVRDAERYRFAIDVPRPVPKVEVPPMLLLPLIENAITHGPAAGHAGDVRVRVAATADGVALSISNPGAFTGRREGGTGIAMVEKRLSLAYGDAARLSVRAAGDETITELTVPHAMLALEAIAS